MNRTVKARLAAVMAGGVLALSACSSGTPASELAEAGLPDLTPGGYASMECSEGVVLGEAFVANEDTAYRAECWSGSPQLPFFEVANDIAADVVIVIDGEDYSLSACPPDVLSERGGVACRAVLVGEQGNEALVRIVVVLSDLDTVLASLETDASQDEIVAALEGQSVEILIGTEPINRG
ncbi:MAG: hypothetical protein CVT64_05060 [Actinobacteria bacterium HGW-Actinobacteria-4]|nr:MAG: hypothetical protein CVT64_05060 [Actinobacteria bacterium HGW-Actinobacteria-4]